MKSMDVTESERLDFNDSMQKKVYWNNEMSHKIEGKAI